MEEDGFFALEEQIVISWIWVPGRRHDGILPRELLHGITLCPQCHV